jgi:hypothetical protein
MTPEGGAVSVGGRRRAGGASPVGPGSVGPGSGVPFAGGRPRPALLGDAPCLRVTVYRLTRIGRSVVDEHLSVDPETAAGSRWAEHADVLRIGRPYPVGEAARLVDDVLARFPGCLVAAVATTGGACVLGARDGRRVTAAPAHGQRPLNGAEFAALGSALHAVLVLGGRWGVAGTLAPSEAGVPGGRGGPGVPGGPGRPRGAVAGRPRARPRARLGLQLRLRLITVPSAEPVPGQGSSGPHRPSA